MIMNAARRRLAGRLVRNVIAAIAVTAIFGFKALESDHAASPEPIALAAN